MRQVGLLGRVVAVSAAALLGGAGSVALFDSGRASEASSDSELTRPVTAVAVPSSTGTPRPARAAVKVAARPATPPSVAPEKSRAPTSMTLPGGAKLTLEPVGVVRSGRHQGHMQIPDDPRVGGWYRFGAAPADPGGAVVVAAHADRAGQGAGPLARLDRVEPGGSITVEVGRRIHRYRVERVERVAKDRLDTEALFSGTGSARLHVVSCGGAYDDEARRYDANVVATAVRVG